MCLAPKGKTNCILAEVSRGNIFPADMEKPDTAEELPITSALFSQERPTSHSGGMKIAVQPLF